MKIKGRLACHRLQLRALLRMVLCISVLPTRASAQRHGSPAGFGMTPEQFWHAPFGTGPRMPIAGDADGDGHADLLSLWPAGEGVIDLARTSALGKPTYGNVARSGFGRDGIVDACGPFVRAAPCADFLAVFADGSVRVAYGMAPGTNIYAHDDLAANIPSMLLPMRPARAVVGDFDADGKADVLIPV